MNVTDVEESLKIMQNFKHIRKNVLKRKKVQILGRRGLTINVKSAGNYSETNGD
jgi:hypothetical protein